MLGVPGRSARLAPTDPRSDAERLEILLIRRAPHRIFPGLWQCVTGGVEPGERIPAAAMREVLEETGLGPAEIEAFYDLDQVAPFYDEGSDAVVVSAIFAARVRPDAEAASPGSTTGCAGSRPRTRPRLAIWPSYAESVRRVREQLLDPGAGAVVPPGRGRAADRDGRRPDGQAPGADRVPPRLLVQPGSAARLPRLALSSARLRVSARRPDPRQARWTMRPAGLMPRIAIGHTAPPCSPGCEPDPPS